MPRTLPVEVIIFAACMGLPQHWGTLRFTTAFLVAFGKWLREWIDKQFGWDEKSLVAKMMPI